MVTHYKVWNGGADVQIDVRQKLYRSVLRVQINDWTPYTAFRLNQCVRSSGQQQGSHWSMNTVATSATTATTSAYGFNYSINSGSDTVQTALGLSADNYHNNAARSSSSSSSSSFSITSTSTSNSVNHDIVVHVHTFDQFFKGRYPRPQVG